MKKVMKLVWMVLFALPMISLTACGDDDDISNGDGVTVNLKDYSDLLDKKADDVMKKMNMEVLDKDDEGIFYENVAAGVPALSIYYTFWQENEYGTYVTYEKSVMVDVELEGFKYNDILNFVNDKYGKGTLNDEGIYEVTKGDMLVWYTWDNTDNTGVITYIKKSEYDKVFNTKAGVAELYNALKARRAARK